MKGRTMSIDGVAAIIFGYTLSAVLVFIFGQGSPVSPTSWGDWIEQHGFTMLFAVVMLSLLVVAIRYAGQFAVTQFRDVRARCDKLEAKYDALSEKHDEAMVTEIRESTECRKRTLILLEDSKSNQVEIAKLLSAIHERIAEKPCQWTEDKLMDYLDAVARRRARIEMDKDTPAG